MSEKLGEKAPRIAVFGKKSCQCYYSLLTWPDPKSQPIYFYMDWAYPGHGNISKKNHRLFTALDKEDPVDAWECERCKRIEQIQRNENPFVKDICVNSGM